MSRLWLDPATEDSLLTEVAQRRQRLSAMRRQVTPMTGMMASSYADAYPWMEPSATQSFLRAGVSPDDPRVQSVAAVAAEDLQATPPSDDVADSWWETLLNSAVLEPVKGTVRTGLSVLSAPWEELQALISSAGEVVLDEGDEFEKGGGFTLGTLFGDLGNLGTDLGEFWDNYTNKAARSGFGLAIGRATRGESLGLGEGWLPAGEVFEQREKDKMRLQLDGEFITAGRLAARDVTEPGTGAYQFVSGLVDATGAIVADPAYLGLKSVSGIKNAHKAFQSYGLIGSARKTVAPKRVDDYLRSGVGRRLTSWLTEQSDVRQVWEATGRTSLPLARRIAATGNETEMADLLSRTLGTVIREKPTAGFVNRQAGRVSNDYGRLFGGGAVVRKQLDAHNWRVHRDMPGTKINPSDVDRAAVDLEGWMRAARMGDEAVSRHLTELARIGEDNPTGVLSVARQIMGDAEGVLVSEWGVNPATARRLTKMVTDYSSAHRAYNFDDLGRHVDSLAPLRVNVGGEILDASPTAGIVSDLIGTGFALPDVREIRRATPAVRQMQKLMMSNLWKGSVDGMDAIMSTVWKPLQLLRGAYTVRVIGEEQVRMGASGYDSLASHPLRAISWMLGADPKSKLGQRLGKGLEGDWEVATRLRKALGGGPDVDPAVGRGGVSLLGERFDSTEVFQHTDAMSRGAAGHAGMPGEILTGRYVRAQRGDDVFHKGWADRLAHVGNDPVMQRLAGGLSPADVKSIRRNVADWSPTGSEFDDAFEWFWSGSGQKFRQELAIAHKESGLGGKLLNDRNAAKEYLRQNFGDQLDRLTGRDSDLLSMIGTGKLGDDINIRQLGANRKLTQRLRDNYDDAAPNYVPVEDTLVSSTPGSRTAQRLNDGVDRLFDTLMSKPTNFLSRSPAFRQMYWQRADELLEFAPRAVQEDIIRAARDANVPRHIMEKMAGRVLKGAGDRVESLGDVDVLAKAFALDGTKKLLYDLSKRSQLFDMGRIAFPFGEAWKEIITSWGRIMYHNPQAARRAQQVIHGARGGDQDPTTGFFHTDPTTNEEVFSYPDFGLFSALAGTGDTGRVTPVGRVAGLNVVSATVLPGFGPMIQIPVQNLVPNTPKFEELHSIVSPFGSQPGDTIGQQIGASFTPAWAEKIQTAVFSDPKKDRLFANTAMDVMRALHRTGDYPIDSPQAVQKLYDDAVFKARLLYFVRGFAQSTLPTGPSFQWDTADVRGNLVPVKLLSDELRRMTADEYDGDRQAAFIEWTRRFGVDNVLAIQAKSQSLLERPVTETGDRWLRNNPDLERTYPLTVGLFAPEDPVGEFDYSAYLRQFETGARAPITPDEMVALANNFLGQVEYQQARLVAARRPGPQSAAWLASIRDDIAVRRPGFDGWVADRVREQRPEIDQQIAELRDAIRVPALGGSQGGQGTIKYFSALAIAEQMTARLPGNVRSYQTAKSAAPIRAFLRATAQDIIGQHPGFARVWESVFSRELADDAGGF